MDAQMKIARSRVLMEMLLVVLASVAVAGQSGPPQPVTWTMQLDKAATAIKAGGTFEAIVAVTIDEGWHVYAADEVPDGPRPLLIALAEKSLFRPGGPLKAPEPERDMDQSFGQVTAFYKADTTFRLPVAVPPGLAAGAHDLVVEIEFQACDGRICLPARATLLKTSITIAR
jgi:DsbC/DsbD-like thiol-disulfide interchange protein